MNAAAEDQGLLNTNAVILLPRLTDPEVLPSEPLISTVTLAELFLGPLVARSEEEVAASLRRSGRKPQLGPTTP